jgi:hypothetical protein
VAEMEIGRWLEEVQGDVCLPRSNFSLVGRERIIRLERAIAKLPQFDCPLQHYFVDGLYVREIFIPKGCVLVGYIHMEPCITTISKGVIVIADGQDTKIFRAPLTFTCPPGSKKAGYALEDTIWADAYVNADNECDVDKLEARLTANTHAEFLSRTDARRIAA